MTTDGYKEIKIGGSATTEVKPTVIEVDLEDVTDLAPEELPEIKVEETPSKAAPVKQPDRAEHNSRAQKRIKQLLADKNEAQAALEQARQEKAELLKQMNEGSKATKTDLKSSLEGQVASLTKQMALAMQNGESELVVQLQDQLIDAKMELKGVAYELKNHETIQPESPKTTQGPSIPDAALAWIEEYPQFKTDQYFHNSAITENNQLLSEGFDPKSEEFYEELNSRLAPRFPKVFGVQEETSVSLKSKASSSEAELDAEQDVKPKASSKVRTTEQTVSGSSRPSANVAPTRKSTSVTLSPQDIAQAERWGLSLEQMARRIAHSEKNKRNDGYVPINISQS